MEAKKIYYNKPQLQEAIIDANELYAIWGRGTGKTAGPLSRRSRRNMVEMPRSTGISIGETHMQMTTRTLPSRIEGWEKLGIIKDRHYFIGRKPPKAWNWPEPFEPPVSYDHFIVFCNGSGIHMVSQDRKGSSNGINCDWIDGDEVKYLNYDQFLDETLPTMRANRTRFSHLPFHHSITFTTSMPTAADAKWILKKREEMDPEQIQLMFMINAKIFELQNQLNKDISTTQKKAIHRQINKYNSELNALRFNSVYYSEASSLDNIAVLGVDYIKKMKRIMPDFIFETEILNKRPDQIEGGFYLNLNLDKHTYTAYNNSYLDSLDYNIEKLSVVDSRMDGDCIGSLPLRIAVDWGDKINCMSIGQLNQSKNEFRFLKCLHVKAPEFLDHLAQKFIDYYVYHKTKEVYFAYDHTGNTGLANSDKTYSDQFAAILRKAGWRVMMVSKGKAAPSHQEKYLLWYKLLKGDISNAPRILFNKNNCKELLISMLQAPAKQGPKGIIKDKNSEKNDNIPQEEATHYSDTADILISQLFTAFIRKTPDFIQV
jgi:hypothetical protein